MKRKNKFLFSVICLTGLAGVLAISGMSKFNSELLVLASNGTQEWNHYEAVAPTFDSNGSKEYWVSCSDPTHPIQFTAPTGDVEITNMGAPSAEFVNSLDSSDARYAPKLPKSVSFEDGQIPSVFSVVQGEATITDSKSTLGTKSLAVSTVSSGLKIAFDRNWLNAVFDSNDAIYFDIVAETQANDLYYNSVTNQWGVIRYAETKGVRTIWNTYTFSRAFFEDLKSDNVVIRVDNSADNTIYIDNIRFGGTPNIISLENNYIDDVYVKSAFDASVSLHVNTSGTFELSNTRATEGTTSLHLVSSSDANIYVPYSFYQKAEGSGFFYDLYVEPKEGAMHIFPDSNDNLIPHPWIDSNNYGRWTTLYIPYEHIDVVGTAWARILGTRSNANGFDIYVDNIRIASEAWSFEQERVLENNFLSLTTFGAGILYYSSNNLEVSDEKSYTGSYSLKLTTTAEHARNIGISDAMYQAIPEGGSVVMQVYTDTAFNASCWHHWSAGQWVEITIPKADINSAQNDHYLGTIYVPITIYIDDLRIVGPTETVESANADILDLGADDVWYN